MTKRILAITMTLTVCMTVRAATVQISSAEELRSALAVWSSENTYELTENIDLDNVSWTPIGTTDQPFTATFDGKGHTISNLLVYVTSSSANGVAGLFGKIGSGGTVKNLMVGSTTVSIDKETEGDYAACYVGSIAGQNHGTIVGCANRGVLVLGNCNNSRVGGIAGENNGSIQNCYNLGEIYVGKNYPDNHLGGIVGYNYGSVKNCFVRSVTDENSQPLNGPICGHSDMASTTAGCFYMDGTPTDAITNLIVKNDEDNDLSAYNNQTKNVLLNGRTLYSDEAWNTLCLPFDIPEGATGYSPIAGATVKALDSATSGFDNSTGVLTLNFTDATRIEAGKPYLIKWDKAIDADLSNPVFLGVTIRSTTPTTIHTKDETLSFVGTFSPVDIYTPTQNTLYLGAENTLYYPWGEGLEHFYVNSCRAYFLLNGPLEVKGFRLHFGDKTSAIRSVQSAIRETSGSWFTLSGKKLDSKPTQRGVYIHIPADGLQDKNSGKKILIK